MAKMNNKLMMTPKDKKLLTGLLCFLIAVGFLQFLIFPNWNEKEKLKKEAKNLQNEINTMQQTIDEMNNEAKSLNAMKTRLKELQTIFNVTGNVEDIDDQLTQLALTIGIDAQSINLTHISSPLITHKSSKEEKQTEKPVIQYKIIQQLSSPNYSLLNLYMKELEDFENVQLNQASFNYVQDEEKTFWSVSVVLTYYERQE